MIAARAQVIHSATASQFSLTVGGTASAFQPEYAGWWGGSQCNSTSNPIVCYPISTASPQALFGVGTYVDVRLTRWVQLEAEGRWQRFNQYYGINQDNYLIGPRLPVYHFWKATAYAKALGGYSKMNFGTGTGTGSFTTIAVGGGLDVKMTKRLSLRLIDAEYQYWPAWGNSTLAPYGASVGIGYKIF